jgi:ATP synthase protein I
LNKASEDTCLIELTHSANVANIAGLYTAREKKVSRTVVYVQVAITLISTLTAYKLNSVPGYPFAVLCGGLISAVNGSLLAWRMYRAALIVRPDSLANAHQELRRLCFYAVERYLVVATLLLLCMAVMKLPPLAVLKGFAMGQAALLATQFISSRFRYK